MNEEQMQQQFLSRYDQIVQSGDTRQMERLGAMVKRVMGWLINYEPEIANAAMSILNADGAKEYHNYLSAREADEIVSKMEPQPQWSLHHVLDMLRSAGYTTEEPPYYNSNALATTMCMILSDSGQTLQRIIGTPSHPATNEELLASVYQLAVDKLKDKDGKFNIRKYFDL